MTSHVYSVLLYTKVLVVYVIVYNICISMIGTNLVPACLASHRGETSIRCSPFLRVVCNFVCRGASCVYQCMQGCLLGLCVYRGTSYVYSVLVYTKVPVVYVIVYNLVYTEGPALCTWVYRGIPSSGRTAPDCISLVCRPPPS